MRSIGPGGCIRGPCQRQWAANHTRPSAKRQRKKMKISGVRSHKVPSKPHDSLGALCLIVPHRYILRTPPGLYSQNGKESHRLTETRARTEPADSARDICVSAARRKRTRLHEHGSMVWQTLERCMDKLMDWGTLKRCMDKSCWPRSCCTLWGPARLCERDAAEGCEVISNRLTQMDVLGRPFFGCLGRPLERRIDEDIRDFFRCPTRSETQILFLFSACSTS
jgi:hypothetical protein